VSLRLATAVAGAVLLAATIVLAVPCGANAGPRPRHPKPELERTRPRVLEALLLHGTHGFTINGSLVNRRRLVLGASKVDGLFNLSGTTYELLSPQTPGSTAIRARIGSLGRIEARFVPRSIKKEAPPSRCHGPKIVVEEGHYEGTLVFRGEGGYTSAHATSAPGTITRVPALTCKPFTFSRRLRPEEEAIAEARHHKGHVEGELIAARLWVSLTGRPVTFKASTLTELRPSGKLVGALISFSAKAHRYRGRIKETSLADSIFPASKTFRLPEPELPNRGAILAPPWPFQGTGTFDRGSGRSASWTGDLRVELPGFGEVHLTGPNARARYCASSNCK
jgi:hypothetical protein